MIQPNNPQDGPFCRDLKNEKKGGGEHVSRRLEDYSFPEQLKEMSMGEMSLLAVQIREFLLENLSKTGGHLASNLGVVELSIALHRVFDSPRDKILWDVGHQSYVHKILTGRAGAFQSLRKLDGLSGFPRREESPHDVYDAGHSSDSISVALGIADARDMKGEDFSVVAVIGDGAMTGGVAYEGLNNAGISKSKILIILNDNQMSISENIGGMSQHLSKLRTGPMYQNLKKRIKSGLSGIPVVGQELYRGIEHLRDTLKYAVLDGESSLFEGLGLKYYGPVDGHNLQELIPLLEALKEMDEPVLLHVVTKKGKGFSYIEKHPDRFHGVGPFDLSTFTAKGTSRQTYSQIFAGALTELAEKDERVVAVSAAMVEGTGLAFMQKRFPRRVFDVGIAEQHAVSFASGLALGGLRPFVAIYSTFLQRAYDEILTNVCLQKLPVVFCIDRAGNTGGDGQTHNGQFDLSYLLPMPNMTVMAPGDGKELEQMLDFALTLEGPCAIRYPRGEAPAFPTGQGDQTEPLRLGKGVVLSRGKDVCLFALGKMLEPCRRAAALLEEAGYSTSLVNARFAKPFDQALLKEMAESCRVLVTAEDNGILGGLGQEAGAFLHKTGEKTGAFFSVGWPDTFIPHGDTGALFERWELDGPGIARRVLKMLKEGEKK